jgi:hypothetical protein
VSSDRDGHTESFAGLREKERCSGGGCLSCAACGWLWAAAVCAATVTGRCQQCGQVCSVNECIDTCSHGVACMQLYSGKTCDALPPTRAPLCLRELLNLALQACNQRTRSHVANSTRVTLHARAHVGVLTWVRCTLLATQSETAECSSKRGARRCTLVQEQSST